MKRLLTSAANRIIVCLALLFATVLLQAKTVNKSQLESQMAVDKLAADLANWSTFKDEASLDKVNQHFTKQARCTGAFVENVVRKNGLDITKNRSVTWETMFNAFDNEILSGNIVTLTNVRSSRKEEWDKMGNNEFDVVISEIRIENPKSSQKMTTSQQADTILNQEIILYVRKSDGKIAKIDDCKWEYVQGQKRLKVNFSDIVLEDFAEGKNYWFGLIYNYSKYFDVGFSIVRIPDPDEKYLNFKNSYMTTFDFGYANKRHYISTRNIEMIDINNYTVYNKEYHPDFYLTFTESFCRKYFSVGLGAGVMLGKCKKLKEIVEKDESAPNGEVITFVKKKSNIWDFVLRPNVRMFIPIGSRVNLVASASYIFAFRLKKFSGFDFGGGVIIAF